MGKTDDSFCPLEACIVSFSTIKLASSVEASQLVQSILISACSMTQVCDAFSNRVLKSSSGG